MENEFFDSREMTAHQILNLLSPQSNIPGMHFYDHHVIDNKLKWNHDINHMIGMIKLSNDGLKIAYNKCPFPDQHGITLCLSDVINLLYQLIILVKTEIIEEC